MTIIINCFLQGKTENATAKIVQKHKTTIYLVIKKYKPGETVKNKPKNCRTKKLSEVDERRIERKVRSTSQCTQVSKTNIILHRLMLLLK